MKRLCGLNERLCNQSHLKILIQLSVIGASFPNQTKWSSVNAGRIDHVFDINLPVKS